MLVGVRGFEPPAPASRKQCLSNRCGLPELSIIVVILEIHWTSAKYQSSGIAGNFWNCRFGASVGLPVAGARMMKLTKRAIDAVRATDREHCFWDDELPGFGLRIYPSGKKVFIVQYKVGGRRGQTR